MNAWWPIRVYMVEPASTQWGHLGAPVLPTGLVKDVK